MSDTSRLDRSVTVHFMGDPGRANFHRILGWLSDGLWNRSGSHTRTAIWNGWGFLDNVRAVGRGEVDAAIATPASFVQMGLSGAGPYAGESFPHLRALATMPQWDRMVLMVNASLNVRSCADIRARKTPLRIATAADDGVNHIGLAATRMLQAAGVPFSTLESWGGGFVDGTWFGDAIAVFRNGTANAILQEAVMTDPWQKIAASRAVRFISFEDEALVTLEREPGWQRATVPAGYFPTQDEPFETLDFSDFLVFARADMPEDLAYVLTRCMVETREALEARYRHLPPERSPLNYPIEPAKMATTPIPLHPGAARYYASQGLLPAGTGAALLG